jgi:hypothetical protein
MRLAFLLYATVTRRPNLTVVYDFPLIFYGCARLRGIPPHMVQSSKISEPDDTQRLPSAFRLLYAE